MSVLVISIDDLAAFTFMKALYGGTVHTPNIDRLMAMGTTFENGFSQVALCNPSRTSAMTGLSPAHTGVHQNAIEYWNAIQPQDLLMSHFLDAGYHTSVIGKVMHSTRVPTEFGAQFADYIFEDRTDVGGNAIGVLDDGIRPVNGDEVNVAQALELLAGYDPADPFAMFVGINKPHLNWVVPQEFYDLYPIEEIVMTYFPEGDLDDLPDAALALTGVDRWNIDPALAGPEAMQAYLAAVSYADHLLGQLLDQLDASGLAESTTIVLWTDHGHHLGDKDQWGKFTLWEDAARAPFVIAQPGTADDGQVVSQVVELVDLMPTLLDLEGLAVPTGLDGRSLVSFIENPSLLDDGVAITSMDGNVSIRTNEWRYTRYANADIELYAASDLHNIDNLAADPAYADIVAEMNALLYAEAAEDGWIIGSGTGELFGTDASETFVPYMEHTIHGGDGNDLYHLVYGGFGFYPDIVELENGGYDTIRVSALRYAVPDNIERVIGMEAESWIWGNASDNVIYGGQYMWGAAGNDEIYGRGGDDFMVGGKGDDLLHGGFGWDTADYSDADSAITMQWRIVTSTTEGRDTLRNVEQVIGSRFDDTMYGTINGDSFFGNDGADHLVGEEGDDFLYGGNGHDALVGGLGADVLEGDFGDDYLRGGIDNDSLFGSAGWDLLDGGGGNDLLDGGNGFDTASYLYSAVGVEVYLAHQGTGQNTRGLGVDTLVSIEGLQGSAHNDILGGDDAFNKLLGEAGDDTLTGFGGDDILIGGLGMDTLSGDLGNDDLRGGDGADTLFGWHGFDLLQGENGDDRMYGENGNDRLYGDAGLDILDGGSGSDRLFGGADADTLLGGDGNDELFGGDGNDVLDGGLGRDILIGGTGADTFAFGEGGSARFMGTADRILYFNRAEGDRIDLSQIDAIAGGADDAFSFIGKSAFSSVAGQLRYFTSGGSAYLAGDTDGDGSADFIVAVDGLTNLTAADFIL